MEREAEVAKTNTRSHQMQAREKEAEEKMQLLKHRQANEDAKEQEALLRSHLAAWVAKCCKSFLSDVGGGGSGRREALEKYAKLHARVT